MSIQIIKNIENLPRTKSFIFALLSYIYVTVLCNFCISVKI